MLINQEKSWQKRQKYLNEMHKAGKKFTPGQWDAISNELSVREMHALSGYAKEGVNTQTTIGSEECMAGMVRDPHIQPGAFTAWGKLSPEGIARILEALKKKYRVHVQISCVR